MSAAPALLAFAASAVLSFAGVGIVLVFLRRKAVLDVPNERSAHREPTPRGGGLGFVAAIALCLAGAAAWTGDLAFALLAVPVVAACAVGFADDRRPMSWGPKTVLLLAAGALALPALSVDAVTLPFAGVVPLGALAIPLSLFWYFAYANAFNFMDGLNGISALTALVSGAAFAAAGTVAGDLRTAVLGAVAAGAGAGFLPWNFPRARLFMGDSGSLGLGTTIALTAVSAAHPPAPGAPPALEFPASVLLLGPYVFDVAFTLVRRARQGKPLGIGHSEHLYQRFARGARSHVLSALAFAALAVATSALALTYASHEDLGKLLSLLLPPAALLAFSPCVLALERRRAEHASG